MDKIILTLFFGKDQWEIIDAVLDDMEKNNRVINKISMVTEHRPDLVRFDIEFADIYAVYNFGYHQARAAEKYFDKIGTRYLWTQWLQSAEGKKAAQPDIVTPGNEEYLINRLWRAFSAGNSPIHGKLDDAGIELLKNVLDCRNGYISKRLLRQIDNYIRDQNQNNVRNIWG